jgi:hypothetical protein
MNTQPRKVTLKTFSARPSAWPALQADGGDHQAQRGGQAVAGRRGGHPDHEPREHPQRTRAQALLPGLPRSSRTTASAIRPHLQVR